MLSQVHHLVARAASADPVQRDRPALTFKDVTLTYGQLSAAVASAGARLKTLGANRGDRVGIYLDKRLETVISIFGISAGEGVFVPINPLLRPRQVSHILGDCDVKILITTAERFEALEPEIAARKALEQVVLLGTAPAGPVTPRNARYQVTYWNDGFEPETATDPVPGGMSHGVDADVAAILYTSGSTGSPKGVVLSHRNLIVGGESVSQYLGNTADDVILSVLPLSFDAGLSQLTTAFCRGAHVVLMNYLLPADVVRLCAKHKVTGLTCVPPLWIQIAAQNWPTEAASHLRYFANTGGRMPRSTLDKLRAIFPQAAPFLMYGLTEAFRSTYLDPAEVDRRPDSIGKAIPNAEILVVRPDGSICDTDEEGELVHRGALVALGYWNDPERTAARFRPTPQQNPAVCATEMAVFSGDTVRRDAEGFLYFVGRQDEMIKTSGYRVSPTEVEEAAYETGQVLDAVAFGIEDDQLGQRIVLVVATAPDSPATSDSILGDLKRALPPYMVPSRLIVLDELPRSPNGKFDRNLLRQQVTAS